LIYRGKTYQCNICSRKLRHFIKSVSGNNICPACGSAPRNRRLWSLLEKDFLKTHTGILHFSPARALYRKLKTITYISYCSSDFAGEFLADKNLDITAINEKDATFDLVICYHVLEHIKDDQKAISELYRILKPGGTCLLQTPFKEGDIYEDETINTPQKRLKYYGQADHLRIYSVSGLKERLTDAGFKVTVKEFKETKDNYFGFKTDETVIVAKK
jgi:SAM-dependent methyltransferase